MPVPPRPAWPLVLAALVGGGLAWAVTATAQTQPASTPPARALCIGFKVDAAQTPDKTAGLAEEWMNQQLSSGRSRFLSIPRDNGWVVCGW